MKTCVTCKSDLPEDAFGDRSKAPDGKNYSCKACVRAYNKLHYGNNKQSYLDKARKWEAAQREIIRAAKSKPCADCGRRFHPAAMDFDHLPGSEKSFGLGQGHKIGRGRVAAEIAKCDVVCANCHRVRTFNRYRDRVSASPCTPRASQNERPEPPRLRSSMG